MLMHADCCWFANRLIVTAAVRIMQNAMSLIRDQALQYLFSSLCSERKRSWRLHPIGHILTLRPEVVKHLHILSNFYPPGQVAYYTLVHCLSVVLAQAGTQTGTP